MVTLGICTKNVRCFWGKLLKVQCIYTHQPRTPLEHPLENILLWRQSMKSHTSCYIMFGDHSCYKQCSGCEWALNIGKNLVTSQVTKRKRFLPRTYWNSSQSCTRLQIGAVPTVDAVASGEVNSYNFIVRLRSLPRFA